MRKLTILVLDGVADGPFGITLDVLGAALRVSRAGLLETPTDLRLSWRVLSIDGQAVRTAAGRTLPVDGSMARHIFRRGEVVVLPGLGMASPEEIEVALQRPDLTRAAQILARGAAQGALLAASCSATFVLGAAGVLDGHEATTTWWLGPEFARRFPRVSLRNDRMVVSSGKLITAGAALAHADLMLTLLTRVGSLSLAQAVARYLVLDERASQARYMISAHLGNADPLIQSLERFIAARIDRSIAVSELARAAKTSPRTLARRVHSALGTTPLRLVQRIRMSRAVQLLETTDHSVDEVAARVGYAEPAAFRRVLYRETGYKPRELRRARR